MSVIDSYFGDSSEEVLFCVYRDVRRVLLVVAFDRVEVVILGALLHVVVCKN